MRAYTFSGAVHGDTGYQQHAGFGSVSPRGLTGAPFGPLYRARDDTIFDVIRRVLFVYCTSNTKDPPVMRRGRSIKEDVVSLWSVRKCTTLVLSFFNGSGIAQQ